MEAGLCNCPCHAGGGQGTAPDTSSRVPLSFPPSVELHGIFCITAARGKMKASAGAWNEALVVYGKVLISQCFCICLFFK